MLLIQRRLYDESERNCHKIEFRNAFHDVAILKIKGGNYHTISLAFLEESQRSIKQIRERIEHYEKRNVEIVSKWPNGMPEWAQNEKYNIDTKISELKWTIYDD